MRYPPRKLTEAFIAGIKPPASGRDTYPDTEIEGLELRISAEAKSWSFVHWIKDQKRRGRETLGRWPTVSVIRAREKVRITGGLVADREDPGEVRRALKAQLSLDEAFDVYLKDREAHGKRSVDDMRATWDAGSAGCPGGSSASATASDAPRRDRGSTGRSAVSRRSRPATSRSFIRGLPAPATRRPRTG